MAGGSAPGERRGGRTKGTPNKVNAATRERIEREADPIGFLCRVANGEPIDAAPVKEGEDAVTVRPTLDQRLSAAQTLARKIQPDAKDTPISLDLPVFEKAEDMVSAMAAVVSAVAGGRITPSEAQAVASVVETQRKVIETVEIERRLDALEERAQR